MKLVNLMIIEECLWTQEQAVPHKKILVVVIYDIADDKRRGKLSKFLESYGHRVQKSVFELLIERSKINKIRTQIDKIVRETDLVKMYVLKGVDETFIWGNMKKIEEEDVIFW